MFDQIQFNNNSNNQQNTGINTDRYSETSHGVQQNGFGDMATPQTPLTKNDPYSQFVDKQQELNLQDTDAPHKLDQMDRFIIRIETVSSCGSDQILGNPIPINLNIYSDYKSITPMFSIKQNLGCCASDMPGILNNQRGSDQGILISKLKHVRNCFCLKCGLLYIPFIGWIGSCIAQCCCKNHGELEDQNGNMIAKYQLQFYRGGVQFTVNSTQKKYKIKSLRNCSSYGARNFKVYDEEGNYRPEYQIFFSKDQNLFYDQSSVSAGEYVMVKFPLNISRDEKMALMVACSKIL